MISRTSSISALALLVASAGAAAAFPATVTTDLNVRSGPGTGYSIVDQLQAGDTVEVVESSGSWYQLADGGWASASYLDADGSAAVVDTYPSYYGTPAFYYGSDPFFWDDGGYYWYWRAGRRHRVDHDWWRGRNDRGFRWSNDNFRRDFERRRRSADVSVGNDGPRRNFGSEGPRRNFGNDGPRRSRNVGGNDGPTRSAEGQANIRTGRASAEGGPRMGGRGSQGGGPRIQGGGGRGGGEGRGGGGGGRGGGGGYGGGGGGGPVIQR
jgi:uncharacterized protein YraI